NYLEIDELDQSEQYVQMARDFIQRDSTYLTSADYLLYQEALVNYFFRTKQFDRANEEYNLLLEKNKAFYANKYAQSIAEMSTIYQLRAKEKHISGLSRQVVQTENKLAQNRLWLIISVLSALLTLSLLILFYLRRKQLKLKQEKENAQLQKRTIELQQQLLRTQMEPHFIFNTLGALQSYIRIEEKEKALRYLNQFSRLLRNSLELSRESSVSLETEIETLAYYLGLQQMRYEDSFDFEIERLNEEVMQQVLIPPMLIQPFVENAILHGVAHAENRGENSCSTGTPTRSSSGDNY